MSAELESQIIGRANRLGRTSPLEVVYLIHENEIGAH
jgi:SNF2 family DNA or RNA helicase